MTVHLQPYQQFFDAELAPLVRRMADRAHTGAAAQAQQSEVRAIVWQGLVDLGVTGTASLGELVDLAELMGSVPYQGPLLDTLTAREILVSEEHRPPGQATVALAVRERGGDNPSEPAPMRWSAGEIHARRCFVGFASEVDYLLVVGGPSDDSPQAGEVSMALVRRDQPGVRTRRYEETGQGEAYEVWFDGARADSRIDGTRMWLDALARARLRQAGYLVGLARSTLDLAVDYAKQRKQFGRFIGRNQSIAFRLSALSMQIDAIALLVRANANEAVAGRHAAAQCLAAAADLATTTATACLQVHGATGMTNSCDAQLFYRRAVVESMSLGTPAQLRTEAIPLLAERLTETA
jgi:Acyl-CoA dehydrogenase, C-terminal domain